MRDLMCFRLKGVRFFTLSKSAFKMPIITSIAFFTGMEGYMATTSKDTCTSLGEIRQVLASFTNSAEFFIVVSLMRDGCITFTKCLLTLYAGVPMVDTIVLAGSYEFNVYRKDAITNVQIKPNSSHDEKVKYGVFKGFVHRAMTICSEKYVKDELELLVKMFVENGYSEKPLRNIIKNFKLSNTRDPSNRKKIVSLPYVPTISKKLRTVFQKAGFSTVFKSGRNLSSILTSRNKDQLPKNSYPGVYRAPCYCKRRYIGHTGKQTRTREKEHEKAVFNGSSKSAIGEH